MISCGTQNTDDHRGKGALGEVANVTGDLMVGPRQRPGLGSASPPSTLVRGVFTGADKDVERGYLLEVPRNKKKNQADCQLLPALNFVVKL